MKENTCWAFSTGVQVKNKEVQDNKENGSMKRDNNKDVKN
jgi:hypothetical protein